MGSIEMRTIPEARAQTVSDAIGVLMSAADVRAEQWAGVANNKLVSELVDELHEADAEEGARMCDLIEDAMITVRNAKDGAEYPCYTTDTALTAMIINEWFVNAAPFCREHYTEGCGAATLRCRFLFCADTLNKAWEIAQDWAGYDECFDWEFVPCFMEWAAQLEVQPKDFEANAPRILEAMGIGSAAE
jgi:hypothetical protein